MAKYKMQICILVIEKISISEVSIQELVQQIKGRKVAEKKFPFESRKHYFPPNLNLEQASSQDTADFKNSF